MTPLAPLHTRGLLFYWRCSTVVRAGRRGSGPRLGDTASVCECVSESGGSPASPRAQPTSPRCPHVRFTPSPPAPRPTTPGVSVRTPSSSSTSSASGAPPPEPRGGQARVLPLCCWLFGWGEKPAQRRCRSAGCLSLPMCDLTVLTSSLLIVIVQEPSDAQTTDSQCASPPPSRPPRPPPPLSASPEEAALRVSFCPTLPPLVSKGQRLESRRERDWVQSVFLSVRPSLRKKAHSGLLLARSQSARRQDIRLRVRAEYCEHDAALRSSVSSDKRQPLERQFELFGRASTVLRSRDLGSILCDIKFSELAYLDAFWADYLSGALLEALKGVFITDSLKRAVGQEAVRLLVSVDQDDYEEGRRLLLEAQNGPCCPLAPDAPRARQTRSAARS
nr:PREDICTED: DNA-binding death effector domain-containing protein 2 isoform X2 [Lepisosteus oculatus]